MIGTIAKETASTFAPVAEAYYLSDAQRIAWYKDTSKHAPYSGGWIYYGRGFIQTTHDYNYKKVMEATGVDVLSNPDLLLQPELAAHAMCIYWRDRDISSMCQRSDWASVRRAVYGGSDAEGVARLQKVAAALL